MSILAGVAIGLPLGAILMLFIGLKLTDTQLDDARKARDVIAKGEGTGKGT